MRAIRRVSAALLLSALGFVIAACSVFVRAEDEDARCELPEGSPCLPGGSLTCQGGLCRPCVPEARETCDLKDNNCNGIIDEGNDDDGDGIISAAESFDRDSDGYKQCGKAEEVDCNDDDPNVHPGAPEICNGFDDNCNSRSDESPNNCKEDEICFSPKGQCYKKGDCRIEGCAEGKGCNKDTGACDQLDCRLRPEPKCTVKGEVCSASTGVCIRQALAGEACNDDVPCRRESGQCVDMVAAGLKGRPDSNTMCTVTCCQSSECPNGMVCRRGATGASLCVRAVDVGTTFGSKSAFESCVGAGDCRSGNCLANKCVDTCCGTETCGVGGTCAYKDGTLTCRDKIGTGAERSYCLGNSTCKTGLCFSYFTGYGECTRHCCGSKDCPSDQKCVNTTLNITACVDASGTDTLGSRIGGETCARTDECRSGSCVDNRCDDFCCSNADCGVGTVCLPRKATSGDGFAMRCQLPPR